MKSQKCLIHWSCICFMGSWEAFALVFGGKIINGKVAVNRTTKWVPLFFFDFLYILYMYIRVYIWCASPSSSSSSSLPISCLNWRQRHGLEIQQSCLLSHGSLGGHQCGAALLHRLATGPRRKKRIPKYSSPRDKTRHLFVFGPGFGDLEWRNLKKKFPQKPV